MERREEYVDNRGLNHRQTVSWDPGVVDSRVLTVSYDCLCLSCDWDEVFVWNGHDEGYGWELWYLPRLYSPLVVDRVTDCLTEIKVPGWSLALIVHELCWKLVPS